MKQNRRVRAIIAFHEEMFPRGRQVSRAVACFAQFNVLREIRDYSAYSTK